MANYYNHKQKPRNRRVGSFARSMQPSQATNSSLRYVAPGRIDTRSSVLNLPSQMHSRVVYSELEVITDNTELPTEPTNNTLISTSLRINIDQSSDSGQNYQEEGSCKIIGAASIPSQSNCCSEARDIEPSSSSSFTEYPVSSNSPQVGLTTLERGDIMVSTVATKSAAQSISIRPIFNASPFKIPVQPSEITKVHLPPPSFLDASKTFQTLFPMFSGIRPPFHVTSSPTVVFSPFAVVTSPLKHSIGYLCQPTSQLFECGGLPSTQIVPFSRPSSSKASTFASNVLPVSESSENSLQVTDDELNQDVTSSGSNSFFSLTSAENNPSKIFKLASMVSTSSHMNKDKQPRNNLNTSTFFQDATTERSLYPVSKSSIDFSFNASLESLNKAKKGNLCTKRMKIESTGHTFQPTISNVNTQIYGPIPKSTDTSGTRPGQYDSQVKQSDDNISSTDIHTAVNISNNISSSLSPPAKRAKIVTTSTERYKMAILKDHSNSKMDEKEMGIVHQVVLKHLDISLSNGKAPPLINDFIFKNNMLIYCCNDDQTCKWLIDMIDQNEVLKDIKLKVMYADKLPKPIRVSFKTKNIWTKDPKSFLKRLNAFNSKLNTSEWTITNKTVDKALQTTQWIFLVDQKSADAIVAANYVAYTGIDEGTFKFLKQM